MLVSTLALLNSEGRALATVPTQSGVDWDVAAVCRHASQDPLFGKQPYSTVHEGGTPFYRAPSHGNLFMVYLALALTSWAWYLFRYAPWDRSMVAQKP